jgi:hypothetical protein
MEFPSKIVGGNSTPFTQIIVFHPSLQEMSFFHPFLMGLSFFIAFFFGPS